MKSIVLIYALVFISMCGIRSEVIWTEDFSKGSYFVTLGGEGSDGANDYFKSTEGLDIGKEYVGFDDDYFAAQDIDDGGWLGSASPSQLTWTGVDICGREGVVFSGKFASTAKLAIDAADYVSLEYRIDNGEWKNLMSFKNNGTSNSYFLRDTDFDGVGDRTLLSDTAFLFVAVIDEVGDSLALRITCALNSEGEDFAFDDFSIEASCSEVARPVVIESMGISTTGFRANWEAVSGASYYILDVWTEEVRVVESINEDFLEFSDWTNRGSGIDNNELHAGRAIPCRSMGVGDSLWTSVIDYPAHLSFFQDASGPGDGNVASIAYRSHQQPTFLTLDSFVVNEDGFVEDFYLTSISTHTNVKFALKSKLNSWYLDDVEIKTKISFEVFIDSSLNVGSVTSCDVTGLEPLNSYKYTVTAVGQLGCVGEASSISEVITLEDFAVDVNGADVLIPLVYGSHGQINFRLNERMLVSVYDISGCKVHESYIDGQVIIPVSSGIYVVRIGSVVVKVVVS
jgi:hypothetical protein